MAKSKSQSHKSKSKKGILLSRRYIIGVLIAVLLIVGPYLFYDLTYQGKIYPNVYVDGINLGGKNTTEAKDLLSQNIQVPEKITLAYDNKSFDLKPADIDVSYDYQSSIDRAYELTRTGNFIYDTLLRLELLKRSSKLGLALTLNEEKLDDFINGISNEISVKPIYPSIKVLKEDIQVDKGSLGKEVDIKSLRQLIGEVLAKGSPDTIYIPTIVIDPTLNEKQVEIAKARGESFVGKTLSIKFEYSQYDYRGSDLLKFVNPAGGFYESVINDTTYKLASSINRDPQNPKFQFDGTRVTEFVPAADGVTIKTDKFKEQLLSKLESIEQNSDKVITFDLPVTRTKPTITTDKVNNLGIRELIGRGTSTYFHSIPGRVFNVNLAASRVNGTLVGPGETFSFNNTVGDISKETGYKEAYVISQGKTVLGDGGGVCQVSTTLFRAVLNSGLPINDRTAHAYRVGYYEQNSPPGIDATVYGPRPDFKFTNDTGNNILIVAKNDPKNYSLVFEIYGTSDGRVATISKPVVSNYSPALPTVYQDDPTLPMGTLKQVDYAAAGAKVTFNYSVSKDGQEIYHKIFVSNYQPWAAVYLRGTKI